MDLGDPEALRLRCLGHVINLACEAFLGAKEDESSLDFEDTIGQDHLASRPTWRAKM